MDSLKTINRRSASSRVNTVRKKVSNLKTLNNLINTYNKKVAKLKNNRRLISTERLNKRYRSSSNRPV